MQRSGSLVEPNQLRILKTQKKELTSKLEEKNEQIDEKNKRIKRLEEELKTLQMKLESSQSRGWPWGECQSCVQKTKEIRKLTHVLEDRDQEIEKLSYALNVDSRRRQGDLADRKSPEFQMSAVKHFFQHKYRAYVVQLGDRKFQVKEGEFQNSREYLCTLFQNVYDCTYWNLLKEIGAKIFQPPNQEVSPERSSMFLQGYSLLIAACELTEIIPEDVKAAVEKKVKEDMKIGDKVLCKFISEVLPITWGMVTTTLPLISSNKALVYDPNVHTPVVESQEEIQAVLEWTCSKPALYRCLELCPEEKAIIFPRVLKTKDSMKRKEGAKSKMEVFVQTSSTERVQGYDGHGSDYEPAAACALRPSASAEVPQHILRTPSSVSQEDELKELQSKLRTVSINHTDLNKIAQQLGIRLLEKPKHTFSTAEEVVYMITCQTSEKDFLTALSNLISALLSRKKKDPTNTGKRLEMMKEEFLKNTQHTGTKTDTHGDIWKSNDAWVKQQQMIENEMMSIEITSMEARELVKYFKISLPTHKNISAQTVMRELRTHYNGQSDVQLLGMFAAALKAQGKNQRPARMEAFAQHLIMMQGGQKVTEIN